MEAIVRIPVMCGSLALLTLLPACRETGPASPGAPLFVGMGDHHRAISTKSKDAQRWFDQGLTFAFCFNHDEAIRSFERVAALDPKCAMAWWGIALVNGPHINNPMMDPEHSKAAWDALTKALALAPNASPVERALIDALGARYGDPTPADRAPLDHAYADAMRKVWQSYPTDPDVGTLFAESMMDLRPWKLWTLAGAAEPGTEEIVQTLETVLRMAPRHPGANHLYVHAVEASPHPEKALAAADLLRDLVPAAGHMVHMPAHIYCHVGRWADASACNERAIKADSVYRALSPEQGFYRIYMAHNHHFLAWSSMMEGRSAEAIQSARDMIAGMPPEWVQAAAYFADGYMTIAIEALMRFGRWEEILAEPAPPDYLPITTAHWRFARGVAYAATDRVAEAKSERAAFLEARTKVTDDMIVGNNSAQPILDLAANLLDGEIAYREQRIDDSIASLREAVRIEDSLAYDEAPDWIQPVRHTLGGVLFLAGRVDEAETVYREDLALHPENGWSLFGLARSLHAKHADAEAQAVEARFTKAWARADIKLASTCMCLPAIPGF